MSQTKSTKEKLLDAGRELFWTRGYSNVSIRDITKAAGVDVALVSRYFGSKQGLFEATLAEIPRWEALDARREDVLDAVVAGFSYPFDPKADQTNPFTMLLTNITDPEMGGKVRSMFQRCLADPLAETLGGAKAEVRAAMLLAALFGMALMRKNFQLEALTGEAVEDIEIQTRHLAAAALEFGD